MFITISETDNDMTSQMLYCFLFMKCCPVASDYLTHEWENGDGNSLEFYYPECLEAGGKL